MKLVTLFLPLLAIIISAIPLIKVFSGKVDKLSAKRRLVSHIGLYFSFLFAFVLMAFFFGNVSAEETSIVGTNAQGLGFVAAALSTGLSSLGAGIAVGNAAPAAIGAFSENEKNFSKSLIFVVLGEGVALYGMLISILIITSL